MYASFTASEMSWRCNSTFSTATSASFRAASVAARFLPKSKRSWESCTWARKVSESWRDAGIWSVWPVVCDVMVEMFWLRVANAEPESWGSSGASACVTR